MPDQVKPYETTQQTDDERRKAATTASAQNSSGDRGTQIHAPPEHLAKPKESFEHAGRAVRAQPSLRQDPANQRQNVTDEDTDASPLEDDQRDLNSDEDTDPSDASFPIDERIERKTRAQQTADEEED